MKKGRKASVKTVAAPSMLLMDCKSGRPMREEERKELRSSYSSSRRTNTQKVPVCTLPTPLQRRNAPTNFSNAKDADYLFKSFPFQLLHYHCKDRKDPFLWILLSCMKVEISSDLSLRWLTIRRPSRSRLSKDLSWRLEEGP